MKKSKRYKPYNVDPRTELVPTDRLEFIADCPAGGSGEGSYITGRIQSMAREILEYRKKEATAFDKAAKVVEDYSYMLGIGSPEEGPWSRQDRVCKETREQAAAAIRALKEIKENEDA